MGYNGKCMIILSLLGHKICPEEQPYELTWLGMDKAVHGIRYYPQPYGPCIQSLQVPKEHKVWSQGPSEYQACIEYGQSRRQLL